MAGGILINMNKNGNPGSLVAAHPGNTNAAKYGVYSPRIAEPRVAEIVAEFTQRFEFSANEQIALGGFARSAAILERIDLDLMERGIVDKRGEARSLLNHRARVERQLEHWLVEDRAGHGTTSCERVTLLASRTIRLHP